MLGVWARKVNAELEKNKREKKITQVPVAGLEKKQKKKQKHKKKKMSSANKQKQSWKCQTQPPYHKKKKRVQRSASEGVHLYGCS